MSNQFLEYKHTQHSVLYVAISPSYLFFIGSVDAISTPPIQLFMAKKNMFAVAHAVQRPASLTTAPVIPYTAMKEDGERCRVQDKAVATDVEGQDVHALAGGIVEVQAGDFFLNAESMDRRDAEESILGLPSTPP